MKMDVEGYEEALLDVELTRPAVIEVHGLQLRDKFQQKGYRIAYNEITAKKYECICFAYWMC